MNALFSQRAPLYIAVVLIGGILLAFVGNALFGDRGPERERAIVNRGDVETLVSVSGSVRTPNTATLGFPQSGSIETILVREGDSVEKGEVLASLGQSALVAEYNDALAYLAIQEAYRDELIAGPRSESRDVITTTVAIAEANLERTIKEQEELVASSLRALYSTDLEAVPEVATNDDAPPTISGTYLCEDPTTYRFDVYRSRSQSGYSYRITEGNGTGAESAVTESATPFGSCGLYIQFEDGEMYGNESWEVRVPNDRGARYTTNLNAYNQAVDTYTNAIDAAEQTLQKAKEEGVRDTALPRAEELVRADANIAQARARLAAAEARIADVTIRAPFAGVVTSVDIAPGEVGNAQNGITMTADDAYELKIRIPEIDIARIEVDQKARAVFDANPSEVVNATITFVSPLPTEIDGVAYYEALLALDHAPEWMRTGLNADVDVIVSDARGVLTVPRRFILEEDGTAYLLALRNGREERVAIEVGETGNDGYAEVRGVDEGTTVIAP